jgi:hypothetical protein
MCHFIWTHEFLFCDLNQELRINDQLIVFRNHLQSRMYFAWVAESQYLYITVDSCLQALTFEARACVKSSGVQ